MAKRTKDPSRLPPEIFSLILGHLSVAETLRLIYVSKSWKEHLHTSPLLWRDWGLGCFKVGHERKGVERILELAGGRTRSLAFSKQDRPSTVYSLVNLNLPSIQLTQGVPYGLEDLLIHIADCSPNLFKLQVSTTLLADRWVGLTVPQLEVLEVNRILDPSWFIETTTAFAHVTDLTFSDVNLKGSITRARWPASDTLSALKNIKFSFFGSGCAQGIDAVSLRDLARAAPNLESVTISKGAFQAFRHWATVYDPGFQDFTNLKKLILDVDTGNHGLVVLPPLPESLEKLSFTTGARYTQNDFKSQLDLLPVIPNLKELEIDIDHAYNYLTSFWGHVIENSACRITHLVVHEKEMGGTSQDYYWLPRLFTPLARAGHFSELQSLVVITTMDTARFHVVRRMNAYNAVGKALLECCPKLTTLKLTGACDLGTAILFRLRNRGGGMEKVEVFIR